MFWLKIMRNIFEYELLSKGLNADESFLKQHDGYQVVRLGRSARYIRLHLPILKWFVLITIKYKNLI